MLFSPRSCPPLQAIFENERNSQAATPQSSSEEKDKQVTDRARKGSRKICPRCQNQQKLQVGLSPSGTEDEKKSMTLREGTTGVKVRSARRGEAGQICQKLFLKLMWKKFSGNFSCYNFLWVSMENEIYKIRPQTKDNKTKG